MKSDQIAGRVAGRLGYAVEVYEADWNMGRRAGLERNIRMLDSKPDLMLALWDGQSRGTEHTITEARRRNPRGRLRPLRLAQSPLKVRGVLQTGGDVGPRLGRPR